MTLPYNAEGDPIASPPLGDTPVRDAPVQDVVPRGERNQDELRSEITQEVTSFPSRPLTHEEKEAAEHDVPRGERVYAPASERVPKPPVPGHRELVEHPDEATPERQAAPGPHDGTVHRSPSRRRVRVPLGSATREEEGATTSDLFGVGLAWVGLFVVGAVGMWLFLRWQRERNRPVNRLRRQAQWAADEIRERVPGSPDASTTAIGLAAALLSSGLVLWRRSRSSDDEDEGEATGSQGWLTTLSSRIPRKVEAEAKFSMS
jgi:hypothetical protein